MALRLECRNAAAFCELKRGFLLVGRVLSLRLCFEMLDFVSVSSELGQVLGFFPLNAGFQLNVLS